MDDLDRRILTAIQAGLPVDGRPFDALAARFHAKPGDVVRRVRGFLDDGSVRRLGPVFDSRSLGYVSTLVAARVPAGHVDDVAAAVNRLPGVTHNYERPGAYNLWFTLTAPSEADLEAALAGLRREAGVAALHSLPALAVYKIRVAFDLTDGLPDDPGDAAPPSPAAPAASGAPDAGPVAAATPVPLSADEKHLVRLLQDGLPAEREPLAAVARALGWTPARVVEQVRAWVASGVIRRYGAVVSHRRLGYRANGMAVFQAAAGAVDDAGRRLAAFAEVSHCYRRPPLPDFPYNLYAMVHGPSEDAVRRTVVRMAEETSLAPFDVLFSTREFKKVSMRYFVEDSPA